LKKTFQYKIEKNLKKKTGSRIVGVVSYESSRIDDGEVNVLSSRNTSVEEKFIHT